MVTDDLESLFPGLTNSAWQITSSRADDYNCIAWAAHDTRNWWWPVGFKPNIFWPPGISRSDTLPAFVELFQSLGFVLCDTAEYEPGWDKVALFSFADGEATHAARQLPNGRWTSKIGELEDIEHELDALAGDEFGAVSQVLKRPTEPTT